MLKFQCSSASRKFLNLQTHQAARTRWRFSALQRAENSSMRGWRARHARSSHVSVLFSEPKIPQVLGRVGRVSDRRRVSVLFSEPKIPQFAAFGDKEPRPRVSVLFSEPKIPQFCRKTTPAPSFSVSVLFSEPKIPQSDPRTCVHPYFRPR